MNRYFVNLIVALLPPTRCFAFKRLLWKLIGVSVGSGTKIGSGAKVFGLGSLSFGKDCWIGLNMTAIVPAGSKVSIGKHVDIGPDVLIECGSHAIGPIDRRAGSGFAASVTIGSGTWIGCRATILGGATLGKGTIVAAGAIVLAGDYPDSALLAGVPARVTRMLNKPEDTCQ